MKKINLGEDLYSAVDALITSMLGEPDSSSGHYSLDRGNLQAFAAYVIETQNIAMQKADEALSPQPTKPVPLWEIHHREHIETGSWNGRPEQSKTHESHKSWDDFTSVDALGSATILYRWDWIAPRQNDDEEASLIIWGHDEYYRESTLKLYFINQERAWNFSVFIDVCRKDEPAIREWLAQQFWHTAKLWEPFWAERSA